MIKKLSVILFFKPTALFFIFLIFFGALILFAFLGVRRRRRAFLKKNDLFKSLFSGYGLSETNPWRRTYLHGTIQGFPVWFRWAYQREHTGKLAKPVVFMGVKLPGTEGLKIHLAPRLSGDFALAGNVTHPLGWSKTSDGFYLGKLPRTVLEEQLAVYAQLSANTKSILLDFAGHDRGGVLYPGYEDILIGKEKALNLVNGNQILKSRLDLQTKLVLGEFPTPAEIDRFIKESLSLAESISRDFTVAC